MTVELIVGLRPLAELVAALRTTGVRFNAYAEEVFGAGRVPVAPAPRTLELVVRTIGELGWGQGAPIDEVLGSVGSAGLAPCPLEAALLLRLAWRDHPVWPRITVASPRAEPDETRPRGFYLRDDADGCWLRAYVASDDWVMPPEERLALVRQPKHLPSPR